MRSPTSIDHRLRLRPRDYLVPAQCFGCSQAGQVVLPPGGTELSAQIAAEQHLLILTWRHTVAAPNGAALARRCGVSRQTISRTLLGERWAGQVVLTALLADLPSPADDP